MERLTEKVGNHDGTAIPKKSLVIECGMKKGTPSGFCSAIVTKLAEYEDLEEQGKLLKLPVAERDTVYHLCAFENGESEIIEMKVGCVEPCGALRNHKGVCEIWNLYVETDYTKGYFKFSDFGKTVFLAHEAAEAALKEMSE